MAKLRLEIESLRKKGSKTLFLTILVSLMIIEIATSLLDKGGVIIVSSRTRLHNDLSVYYGESKPRNVIIT